MQPASSFNDRQKGKEQPGEALSEGEAILEEIPMEQPQDDPKPVGHFTRLATYGAMVDTISNNIEQLLSVVRSAVPDGFPTPEVKQDFFNRFLIDADRFTRKCSVELANVLKTYSIRSVVRGTEVSLLANRIREAGFKELDNILLSCISILKELGVDLTKSLEELKHSQLNRSISGQMGDTLDGSHLDPDEDITPVSINDDSGVMQALETNSDEMVRHQEELKEQGQALAFSKALDYIKALGNLPGGLIDYGSKKCFGGDVDYKFQKNALIQVENAIEGKRAKTIAALIDLACAERKELEKKHAAQTAQIAAVSRFKERTDWNQAQATICLCIAGACLLPAWFLTLLAPSGRASKTLAAILGIIGFVALFLGVVRLMVNRARAAEDSTADDSTPPPPPPEF